MEKSFGLLFFLKKSKFDKGRSPAIYLRITANGKSVEISTRQRCDPNVWNAGAGRIDGRTEYARSINTELDILQRKAYDKRKTLLDSDKPVTAENIKLLMLDKVLDEPRFMLMEQFRRHNEQMAALVGREYAPGTLERYTTAYKHTLSFLQYKYKVQDIDITKLDFDFITEFEFWLKTKRNCDHNSTIKYLANMRKIVNRCIRSGWLHRDPFIGFKMTKREIERTALTEFELNTLAEKTLHTERLTAVRDIFLFSCYSGLAYADVKKLKRSEIIIGIDGDKWVVSRRQKTDIAARIPLLPKALAIIEKYKSINQSNAEDPLLPVLSNQKMNAYLKEIADLCGIQKNLTYHLARHTFATTVTLSNGVPIETVSKMLGHRNLKTTQHYARILDNKISQDMRVLKEKF